eukprot:gene38667-47759_t
MSKELSPNWWREAIIYQVYPRSFNDSNGDGVGDLPGITARLDYIAQLGVDIVWISPFFKSPMKDFGYDISDYCDVDPLFGTLADFDALIAKAHSLGLKIMIDQVMSHTAEDHPWFAESRKSRDNPKADWYVWSDPAPDGCPPNNWMSVFGGSSWQWDSRRKQYYMHNFLVSQPDLNFHNPEVQQAHLDALRFWLERGVDGVRMDACNFHFHDRSLRSNPPALVRDTSTDLNLVRLPISPPARRCLRPASGDRYSVGKPVAIRQTGDCSRFAGAKILQPYKREGSTGRLTRNQAAYMA